MEQKSMTALISAFARAYHSENNEVTIFDDSVARLLLSEQEYGQISDSMSKGIGFFNPTFEGNAKEALRWIVDNQLSPSPLGRAAFTEKALELAVRLGASQYLIFAAGYDTFGYRQPEWAKKLNIFEIDHPETAKDKRRRLLLKEIEIPENVSYLEADLAETSWVEDLMNTHYSPSKISFLSMLGLVYYLSKTDFCNLLSKISSIIPKGSSIAFDYPDEDTYTDKAGERTKKQTAMAGAAKEKMLGSYSYEKMEALLAENDFLIYEHLTPAMITEQYFYNYNLVNPENKITAFDNVNYCLAVKQ